MISAPCLSGTMTARALRTPRWPHASSPRPFSHVPYAVQVLLDDHRCARDVSQPLVAERDPAVVQLDEDPLGDQAFQQGPAPLAAGQQPFGDALDVGAVPGPRPSSASWRTQVPARSLHLS